MIRIYVSGKFVMNTLEKHIAHLMSIVEHIGSGVPKNMKYILLSLKYIYFTNNVERIKFYIYVNYLQVILR